MYLHIFGEVKYVHLAFGQYDPHANRGVAQRIGSGQTYPTIGGLDSAISWYLLVFSRPAKGASRNGQRTGSECPARAVVVFGKGRGAED
jgi:hypothetical protein